MHDILIKCKDSVENFLRDHFWGELSGGYLTIFECGKECSAVPVFVLYCSSELNCTVFSVLKILFSDCSIFNQPSWPF